MKSVLRFKFKILILMVSHLHNLLQKIIFVVNINLHTCVWYIIIVSNASYTLFQLEILSAGTRSTVRPPHLLDSAVDVELF